MALQSVSLCVCGLAHSSGHPSVTTAIIIDCACVCVHRCDIARWHKQKARYLFVAQMHGCGCRESLQHLSFSGSEAQQTFDWLALRITSVHFFSFLRFLEQRNSPGISSSRQGQIGGHIFCAQSAGTAGPHTHTDIIMACILVTTAFCLITCPLLPTSPERTALSALSLSKS